LLTANLSTLRGNVPFTTSFILRLLGFINGTKDQTDGITAVKAKGKPVEIADSDTTNILVRKKVNCRIGRNRENPSIIKLRPLLPSSRLHLCFPHDLAKETYSVVF
jgi:hypothetical protein